MPQVNPNVSPHPTPQCPALVAALLLQLEREGNLILQPGKESISPDCSEGERGRR